MTLKRGQRILRAELFGEGRLQNPDRYRKKLPSTGALPTPQETAGEQMKL